MASGWIKMYRKVEDCWLYNIKPYDKFHAFFDLVKDARHKDKEMPFNGTLQTIHKGQLVTSVRTLAEKWGWSKDKVSRFLHTLETTETVIRESDRHRTLITIVNYGLYQDWCDTDKDSDKDTDKDTNKDINKKEKKDNNIYNNIGDSDGKSQANDKHFADDWFEACWKAYPRKKGKGQVKDATKKRLAKEVGLEQMLRCIERYKAEMVGKDEQFVMYGSTFFNSGYVDYLDENCGTGNDEPQHTGRSKRCRQ